MASHTAVAETAAGAGRAGLAGFSIEDFTGDADSPTSHDVSPGSGSRT